MSFSKWAAIAAALVTSAYGGTIISNTAAAPLGPLGGVDFTGTAQVGTQFTMGATAYDNVSVIVRDSRDWRPRPRTGGRGPESLHWQ